MTDTFNRDSENHLSPLDQIRQAEAEVSRHVASARETTSRKIAKARTEAAQIKSDSRAKGEMNGQALYREMIAKADEEAEVMVDNAQSEADRLRHRGKLHMEAAVEHTLQILLEAEESSE